MNVSRTGASCVARLGARSPHDRRRVRIGTTLAALLVSTVATIAPAPSASAGPTVDGAFDGTGFVAGGSVTALRVGGRGGVPTNAEAATLNLTVTEPAGAGYATVWPCGAARPTASNINYAAGQTIASSVITELGTNGDVCIFSDQTTHLIADVGGYFASGSGYQPVMPARLIDTRPGASTTDWQHAGTGYAAAGSVTAVRAAGRGGVPHGASAASLTLTITAPIGGGYATVWPCGTTRPTASNINFTAGQTIANSVITQLGTNGDVCIYTDQTTHLIADVAGYFTGGSGYTSLTPARLIDTRPTDPVAIAEDHSLRLVNEYRASLGLAPVTLDPAMSDFARDWSWTMSQTWFHHSSGPWAENIVLWGQPNLTPEQAAAGFHQAWLASAPHRANMTNPNWRVVGIGIYTDGYFWYGTHEFWS